MTATATPAADVARADADLTLFQHLEELRSRLFKSAVAIALGFCVGFALRDHVLALLKRPYCALPPQLRAGALAIDAGDCSLIFLDVLGGFFISVKAAAVVAVILAGPVVCYQVWRFVTPGLRPVERRYSLPFVIISQLLFAAGAAFSYVLIPRALNFLLGFAGPGIVSLMDASKYLSFVLRTMIAFGLSFEFPLILILLSLMDVVHVEGLRRYRRHALFGTFVAAAVITPTQDPVTMLLMAGPLIAFYEIALVAARIIERRRASAPVPA